MYKNMILKCAPLLLMEIIGIGGIFGITVLSFLYAALATTFTVMIYEDLTTCLVDLRLAMVLELLSLGVNWVRGSLDLAISGVGISFVLALIMYVSSLYYEEPGESEEICGDDGEGLPFLPCMGISFCVLFFLQYIVNFEIKSNLFFAQLQSFVWNFHWVIGTVVFLFLFYKGLSYRRFSKPCNVKEGCGMGDVAIFLVIGTLFGWQLFISVLFCSLLCYLCWYGFNKVNLD